MIDIQAKGLNELIEDLHRASDNLPREIYSALNEASKKTKKLMAKEVVDEIDFKVAQKVIKKQMKVHKNREELTVTVSMLKSARLSLKEFGARQTKKKGVTVKLNNKRGTRAYPNAFIVKKLGGHVYTRAPGSKRFPILKLKGVSPWGVLIKNKSKIATIVQVSKEEVKKQIADRIRFNNLKNQGQLNWQQNEEN